MGIDPVSMAKQAVMQRIAAMEKRIPVKGTTLNLSPKAVKQLKQAVESFGISAVVNELLDNEVHFQIAHHFFSTHLIDQATGKYHGMVCHYGQCPKRQKEACRVPGCGEHKFVRVLPEFQLKPERLHMLNSQILFERP
jgi:hypothetical protein